MSAIADAVASWPVAVHPGLVEMLAYWHDKRGRRTYPTRGEIAPFEIPQLLPYVLLLDAREDEAEARFRLAGESVNRFYGFNVRGLTWGEVRARILADGGTPSVGSVNRQYRRVATGGVGAYRQGVSIRRNTSYLYYARALLPLSDDGVRVDAMIGASFSNQEKGKVLDTLPDVEFLFHVDSFARVDDAA